MEVSIKEDYRRNAIEAVSNYFVLNPTYEGDAGATSAYVHLL